MGKRLLIKLYDQETEIILNNDNDKIDFSDYAEELCSVSSSIILYEVDEDFDEQDNPEMKKIATIYGRYFDIIYAINNHINLFDVFDMHDADTGSLIPYLLDETGMIKEEYFSIYDNIYYLDRITVEEEFKNKGYATLLLSNLAEILMYLAKITVGIIIVQAQPFDIIDGESIMDYDDKRRMERLIKLYEKAGFKRINNSNYLIIINQ